MIWVKNFIKTNNMDLQFWGYEGGNVVATIAGAGGFGVFFDKVVGVVGNDQATAMRKLGVLAAEYPDAFVTIGLDSVLVLAPVVRRAAETARGGSAMNVVDLVLAGLAIGILAYALSHNTSWITVSASFFVVGSSFLRQSRHNPFLLKAGGLALALGGLALAAFGIDALLETLSGPRAMQIAFGALTVGTGLYVAGASLLTYHGGTSETAGWQLGVPPRPSSTGWTALVIHPSEGMLAQLFARTLDRPVACAVENIVSPAVFWASRDTRARKPFATSMWARLPWRVAAGTAAIATATPEGFAFGLANLGWAVGDLAIGSLDWKGSTTSRGVTR